MKKDITRLDQSLCILISMGRILTALMGSDHEMPDPTCLSDFGRVISNEADNALDLLHQYEGGEDDK